MLRDIQFGLPASVKNSLSSGSDRKWARQPKISGALRAPAAKPPFLHHAAYLRTFPSLASLKKFLPSPEITVPQKSVVIPQKVLFRDEKYKKRTFRFFCNASRIVNPCTGNPQLFSN